MPRLASDARTNSGTTPRSSAMILAPEARSTGLTGEQIVRETLEKTPVPV